jgi:hypothetical protein
MRTPCSQAVTYLLDGKQASMDSISFYFLFSPEQEKKCIPVKENTCPLL